jgi:cell surface protein SprA
VNYKLHKLRLQYYRFILLLPLLVAFNTHAQAQNDSINLFPVKNLHSDPYNQSQTSAIDLKDPKNYKQVVEFDPVTGTYTVRNMVGEIEVGTPTLMTYEEYKRYDMQKSLESYWANRLNEDNQRRTGGPLDINIGLGKASAIFGEGGVKLRPQGYAELMFGVKTNRIDNPGIAEDLRKTTIFDFDQKIVVSVNGSVGDRVKMNFDFNTEATFDFDNTINLNYEGKEDDIIKKIEAGNVSLPLGGSLIRGSQSLFGIKTELQFGKLSVATVISQQESETQTMNLKGGAATSDFEIRSDEYDVNRHFFLTHFFEKNYDRWMSNIPVIVSGLQINRIEVWVTNKRGSYEYARNVAGFMDLGEPDKGDIFNPQWTPTGSGYPDNRANTLYAELMTTYSNFRNVSQISATLSGAGMNGGVDFEKVENARLLTPNEYTINRNLGYISLNTSLNSDEVLAVAFEYQYLGKVYVVGEFSTDSIRSPQTLAVKLLKGTNLSPEMKTWDLMMKNIYSLDAMQVDRKDFRLDVLYRSDSLGTWINYIPEPEVNKTRLLNIMNLDRLNSLNEKGSDGFFDWVEGLTILSSRGKIIFPVTKPFSSEYLSKFLPAEKAKKYAYDELYTQTLTSAMQNAEKNKFMLKGSFKAASGSEIRLNAYNIPRGSVKVTAGGRQLTENVDYTVDYASGFLKILNQGIIESGTPISVSMENSGTFSMQKKTMLGTHLNYRFNDDFNLGGTIMHLYERPLTNKVSMGEDPISNTIWGLNGAYKKDLPFITKMVDALPFISTKAPSSIAVNGEIAQLIPGHYKLKGDGSGAIYLDDFEATKIGIDIKHYFAWKISSTPMEFPEAIRSNDLSYGFNRARIAWYTIDRLFQQDNSSLMPSHIKNDAEQRSNHYVRAVNERNLFPNRDNAYGESTLIPTLNLAYYPDEKGPYNYDLNINPANGKLNDPEKRWGGIMRRIESTDFEQANIEYVEFWVMDPFIYDRSSDRAGELVLNLGEVSEDVLKDGRKSFEHGMPTTAEKTDLDSTVWGYVPRKQSLTQAFANTETSRLYQDVGLDGLNNTDEKNWHATYLAQLQGIIGALRGNNSYVDSLFEDPSQDDYQYYRGSALDQNKAGILDRYKRFNNTEGNSPISSQSNEAFSTTGTNVPDAEDINQDNTLSENESYFIYRMKLDPNEMQIGKSYITDIRRENVELANGDKDTVTWYQFRVPILQDNGEKHGSISSLKSIRFVRMYLTKFKKPVVLRFASLEFVRGEWRKYTASLDEIGQNKYVSTGLLDVGSVNIEENSDRSPVNYVLPPYVTRVIDPGQPQLRELNEQAMSLKIKNLSPGDARGVYKNLQMDMRQYKRLQMWVHSEAFTANTEGIINNTLNDDELSIFIRLGSDFKDNYYEYEIPLKLTPHRSYNGDNENDRLMVWPLENRFDFAFELLTNLKLKRNAEARQRGSSTRISNRKGEPVPDNPTHWIYVKGNPTLSDVRSIMIGVRNKKQQSTEIRSGEIWVNELRLKDFDEDGGWAGMGSASLKLADLGTVNVAGTFSTAGFGGLEQNLMQRQLDDLSSFDFSTSLQLGKFFPEKAQVSIPVYYAYSHDKISPKYNPLDEDIKLTDAIDNANTQTEKDSIKNVAQDVTVRKSLSLNNVRVGYGGEKKQFFDPNNFSLNFAYNETERRAPTIDHDLTKNVRGGIQYNYSVNAKPFEPFRKIKLFESNALQLVRDFNIYYLPTQISFRTDMDRNYNEILSRDVSNTGIDLPLSVSKDWYWNRAFDIKYKLSNSLDMSLSSQSNAFVEEIDTRDQFDPTRMASLNRGYYRYNEWRDSVMMSIRQLGRSVMYHQVFNARYDVPFTKIPLLNWLTLDGTYTATYDWDRGPNSLRGGVDSLYLGHTIENNRNIAINSTMNFSALYSKVKFLRDANQKYGRAGMNRNSSQKRFITAKFEKSYNFEKGKKIVINHKLGSDKPNIRIYDENDRQISGDRNVLDDNSIEFTPRIDVKKARVVITARVEEKSSPARDVAMQTARFLMGVKSLSASYTLNNNFVLPGFDGEPNLIGQSDIGIMAPGFAFAFGSQSTDILKTANENNWLVRNQYLTDPYIYSKAEQFRGQASLEPLNGLKITLNAQWMRNQVNGANYSYTNGAFEDNLNLTQQGNMSMTYMTFKTVFWGIEKDARFTSKAFDNLVDSRRIIARRTGSTDINSENVLIPAFMAAYSGKAPEEVTLHDNNIPSLMSMMPNWSVRYDGLSKIPMMQKYFKNVVLSHAYTSTFNVGGFRTNLQNSRMEIPSVNITEALNPLINLNMAFKGRLTSTVDMSRMRNVTLNITSNQIIETISNDYSFGMGYRWDKFNLVINSGGRSRNVSNDLNLRADVTFRDMKTIIRKIEEDYNQPSTGQNAISIKTSADYTLSRSVTLRLYYDRQMINPLVSTSFKTSTSNLGVSFKFQLIQ